MNRFETLHGRGAATAARHAVHTLSILAIAVAAHAEPSPPPVEDFVKPPKISRATVSPSGKLLALGVGAEDGHIQLGILSLDPLGKQVKIIAGFTDADVEGIRWVNDERLVFAHDARERAVDEARSSGLYAIDADGSNRRELIAEERSISASPGQIVSRVLPHHWHLEQTIDDGSSDVIVAENRFDSHRDFNSVSLYRLDTRSGEKSLITSGAPPNAKEFLLDAMARPRAATATADGRTTIYWRPGVKEDRWEPVASFDTYGAGTFGPAFVDAQDRLYMTAKHGRDTSAIHLFDLGSKRLSDDPTIELEGFDLAPAVRWNAAKDRLLGIYYRAEHRGTYWLDTEMSKLQAGIDAGLPAGRSNRLICTRCDTSRFIVVLSDSDRQPGEYFLYDRQAATLNPIGAARPWFAEADQAPRRLERIKARDGLRLPVYLTRPAGAPPKAPLPAVLLVHGGPQVRGFDLDWDEEAAFYASRGYEVIQPEFRGSTGYGWQLWSGGFKQWGRAAQDDLADAVAWTVREGLVDPKRVCIVGASYGGYAALMAPIRSPGVFRCAVSYAGVSDIELLYTAFGSDLGGDWKNYGMPLRVGDRKEDAEQLKETSPLQQAAKIDIPVLVGHGAIDRRVPLEHGVAFRDAMQHAGHPVEWVVYPREAHGLRIPADAIDFYKRTEAFIGRAIGDGAKGEAAGDAPTLSASPPH